MKCIKCNHDIPEDSIFCQFCGEKFEKETIKEQSNETLTDANGNNSNSYLHHTKNKKVKFCKKCGGEIESKSGICTKCGHKYFRLNKYVLSITILSLFVIALGALNIYQYISSTEEIDYQNQQVEHYKKLYEDVKEDSDRGWDKYWDIVDDADFLDEYIVIVPDDNTNRYHRYSCSHYDDSDSFWAFNIKAAQSEGYIACPYCY